MPRLDEVSLKEKGAVVREVKEASTLSSDLILASGAVPRVTAFEKGVPWAEARIDGNWVVDPFHDDQGIAVNVKGKGLVIIGGCSHAGIINTVKHCQDVAQTSKVHAVMGGFHLTGPVFEPIIGPTIEEMKKIDPDFVMPMHCTGRPSINSPGRCPSSSRSQQWGRLTSSDNPKTDNQIIFALVIDAPVHITDSRVVSGILRTTTEVSDPTALCHTRFRGLSLRTHQRQ